MSEQALAILVCVIFISFGVLGFFISVILRCDTSTATRRNRVARNHRRGRRDRHSDRRGPEENDDVGPYNLRGRLFRWVILIKMFCYF